jgi:hypothetical protein
MTKNIKLPLDLGAAGYVRILKRITEGNLALTCLASVKYEGVLRRAYLKVYDSSTQPMAPLNEVMGFLFAQAMNVPSPQVFLIDVPSVDLACFGWKSRDASVRALGTLEAHDPSVATDGTAKTFYTSGAMDIPQIRDRLLRSPAGRALMAFDEAVGNSDRNIGNIVFSWKHGVVAIDHGCILSGPAWTPASLRYRQSCRNVIFELVSSSSISSSDQNSLIAAAEVLLEAYYEAMLSLGTVLAFRTDVTGNAVFDYVWWRALHLRKRLVAMLGLVI